MISMPWGAITDYNQEHPKKLLRKLPSLLLFLPKFAAIRFNKSSWHNPNSCLSNAKYMQWFTMTMNKNHTSTSYLSQNLFAKNNQWSDAHFKTEVPKGRDMYGWSQFVCCHFYVAKLRSVPTSSFNLLACFMVVSSCFFFSPSASLNFSHESRNWVGAREYTQILNHIINFHQLASTVTCLVDPIVPSNLLTILTFVESIHII